MDHDQLVGFVWDDLAHHSTFLCRNVARPVQGVSRHSPKLCFVAARSPSSGSTKVEDADGIRLPRFLKNLNISWYFHRSSNWNSVNSKHEFSVREHSWTMLNIFEEPTMARHAGPCLLTDTVARSEALYFGPRTTYFVNVHCHTMWHDVFTGLNTKSREGTLVQYSDKSHTISFSNKSCESAHKSSQVQYYRILYVWILWVSMKLCNVELSFFALRHSTDAFMCLSFIFSERTEECLATRAEALHCFALAFHQGACTRCNPPANNRLLFVTTTNIYIQMSGFVNSNPNK